MAVMPQVRQVFDAGAKLGEGVLWDPRRGIVWFVDIKRHLLWHFDPVTGSNAATKAPAQIGWAIPTQDDLLLCGLQDGLYTFDPGSRRFDLLSRIPGEPAGNRLNDACTDPWGRVWFGSMDDAEGEARGRFYVFDRGDIRPAGPSGITITNGPAVNAQGDRIYFTDTGRKRIMVADLTRDGVGEARTFADTSVDFPDAFPDGPVVDAEDHVWTALYWGGAVARYSPDGKLVETVSIPARDVTKMGFGGADLATAFVTTATKNMEETDMARYPAAGSVFAFEPGVKGFTPTPAALS